MKGKNIFTIEQINAIKQHINKKVVAFKNDQKRIRNKIRNNYNFYFSDFSSKKGYTVTDLEELIHLGIIQVIDSNLKLSIDMLKLNQEVIEKYPLL